MKKTKNYAAWAQRSRSVSTVLLVLLILTLALNHILAGTDALFRILVSCVPLMIFVPGLRKGRRRSASLLCFALLLYFMVFVSKLGVPGNSLFEAVSTALTVLLFVSAMMFSTWQYRADMERMETSSSRELNP